MIYIFIINAFIVLVLSTLVLQTDLVLPKNIFERAGLAIVAGSLWAKSPVTGIGVNNFIINIAGESQKLSYLVGNNIYRFFQPVHNIFLLITVETGILGLMYFIYLLKICINNVIKKNNYLMQILFVILLTGTMDHYWITLLQTNMLFAIIIGLCLHEKSVRIISK